MSLTEPDSLEITFKTASWFIDKIDYEELKENTSISINLPPQMTLAEQAALIEFKKEVDNPMTIFSYVQLGGNVFLAYGLKYLWNMVNLLQFLVFF